MKRRELLTIAGVAAVCAPLAGFAQETGRKQSSTAKLPGIGVLTNSAGEHDLNPLIAGMFTELQRLGWVNGQSAIDEPRSLAGDPSRLPGFVTELVDRKVNVIVEQRPRSSTVGMMTAEERTRISNSSIRTRPA